MDSRTIKVNHSILYNTDNVWMTLLMNRLNDAITSWEDNTRLKFNNTEFGKVCKVSKQTVGDWRTGRTKSMSGESLLNGADYLGVNARWLCSGTGKMAFNLNVAFSSDSSRHEPPNSIDSKALIFALKAFKNNVEYSDREKGGVEEEASTIEMLYQYYQISQENGKEPNPLSDDLSIVIKLNK